MGIMRFDPEICTMNQLQKIICKHDADTQVRITAWLHAKSESATAKVVNPEHPECQQSSEVQDDATTEEMEPEEQKQEIA